LNFKSFSFHPNVAAGVVAAGYVTPTPIQARAIPQVLKNHDVMGLAQTGTGKTAAFVLPILNRLMGQKKMLASVP
jgi:ATP-dependent RNA helicase RhlE